MSSQDGRVSSPQQVNLRIDDMPSPRPIRAFSNNTDDRDHFNPRRSPTLVRFDHNDPDIRERQRQMDVDSAMQLSRARSGSITTPSRPSVHVQVSPGSPQVTRHMSSYRSDPMSEFSHLSETEEAEIHRARGDYPNMVPEEALDDSEPLGDPHEFEHTRMLMAEDPMDMAGLGGLPMYQPAVHASNFDFGPMESFSGSERERLANLPSSPGAMGMLQSALASSSVPLQQHQADDASVLCDGPHDAPQPHPVPEGFSHRRQRRLSQSTPTFRRQAKLAAASSALEVAAGPSGTTDGVFGPGRLPGYHSPDDLLGLGGRGHDRPYRFSFYSNALPSVIHARSLSELPAEGQSFEDLFAGRSPEPESALPSAAPQPNGSSQPPRRSFSGSAISATSDAPAPGQGQGSKQPKESLLARAAGSNARQDGRADAPMRPSPVGTKAGTLNDAPQEESHTFWLDVLCPTDDEMHMLSKVFAVHPLTTEDILMEETREKIELFRNYYLVCFRSFDQDPFSPTHLEPLNMYIIVFREGILSFHFRATPHPQNVRRRIKQLKDYISVTSDWISYALIDDITDAFGPLIQGIEYEVDSIDELVLILKQAEQSDMLRRIGTCRKKVMGLLRLMGNKADVVKGLAKRCNEHWSVAPKSDIGLYLSDIQDHLITMTQNLNHYEKILSRSHSNYLAQISIDMTDANNQINDVLSKLTALGTVLIPMNLVTGLWGMNVHVPGQDIQEGYTWFISIVGALLAFAIAGAYLTYKLMVSR